MAAVLTGPLEDGAPVRVTYQAAMRSSSRISHRRREYAVNSVAELARRTKEAGHLRPDFILDDLILMIMANDGIHATSPATRVAASRCFAALAIQAFQASPEASPLPPTPA